MSKAVELLRKGRTRELWQMTCGFIEFDIDEFMAVQRRLMLEQIQLLNECELGNVVMRGVKPRTVEEFRDRVPLTTYANYAPYLLEQREDVLPEKPLLWQRTSGTSGEYPFKLVPVTKRLYQELGECFLAVIIFSSSRGKGDITIEEHDRFLYGLAPPPYASGCWAPRLEAEEIFQFIPPTSVAEKLEFEERIREELRLGLAGGIDVLAAVTSVLVALGEQFSQGGTFNLKTLLSMLGQPGVLPRLLRGKIRSKLAGRPMLPRDIWSIKGLISIGTDAAVYREKIREMWGRYPLDVYGCAEGTIMSTQTWDYGTMTFYPFTNFLEFVPEDECRKWMADRQYRPEVFTLDGVKPGGTYGIVMSSFLGGAFVRYFVGDLIRITSLRNEAVKINLPQMVFDSRMDGLINIAGFTRLTEKTIWQALENSGVMYKDWAVKREVRGREMLSIYIEPRPGFEHSAEQAASAIHEELTKLDKDYADIERMLGLKPVEVTMLQVGAFQAYMDSQRAAGADLAHLKSPHMNPPEPVIERLLNPVFESPLVAATR